MPKARKKAPAGSGLRVGRIKAKDAGAFKTKLFGHLAPVANALSGVNDWKPVALELRGPDGEFVGAFLVPPIGAG